MTSLNATNARKKFYSIISDVSHSHNPVHVSSKKGSVVMISEDDWNSISETLHLNSIPGMTKSIKKGMAESLSKCSKKLRW